MQFAVLDGDWVMHFRTGHERLSKSPPDLDTLHSVNAAYSAHQHSIQFAIIVNVRSESWRHIERHDFDDPAEGVLRLDCRVNNFVHSLSGGRIRAADLAGFGSVKSSCVVVRLR